MSNDTEYVTTGVDTQILERIDDETDNRAEWVRDAIRQKLGVDENGNDVKRHVHDTDAITVEVTPFEARFLGNRLWQIGDEYAEKGDTHVEADCKWWARRFHAECKTREDNSGGDGS